MKIPDDRRRLRGWLAEERIKHLEIARRLGCSRQYISAVIGERAPVSARQMMRIHQAIREIVHERACPV